MSLIHKITKNIPELQTPTSSKQKCMPIINKSVLRKRPTPLPFIVKASQSMIASTE